MHLCGWLGLMRMFNSPQVVSEDVRKDTTPNAFVTKTGGSLGIGEEIADANAGGHIWIQRSTE